MSKAGDHKTSEHWERRLFRNSFTYRGERRWVRGWCIKVQWEGTRRTVRLTAENRDAAAREAVEIVSELRRGGWVGVDARMAGGSGGGGWGRTAPLVGVRKYVSDLHEGFGRELFGGIAHDGVVEQIALGTEDPNAARLRAADIQSEVSRLGWRRVRLAHPREVTVAVFWEANPMICTYTTILTVPEAGGILSRSVAGPAGGWQVLVVEPDGPVRRALVRWLGMAEKVASVRGCSSPANAPRGGAWDLILTNRSLGPAALRGWVRQADGGLAAGPRILEHGLYPDSDAIFASVSGVSRGYFLKRLPPARLIEPLLKAYPEGRGVAPMEEDRQIRRYFQGALEPVDATVDPPGPVFSQRETQVLDLLERGFSDKEVGNELKISVWTVHSHLKRIFGKYGVRTRTEAVVRHLQK